jgi:hypothetical protein
MLRDAYGNGARAALEHLKIAGYLGSVARNLVGHPDRVFVEGGKALGHDGFLSARNVFWPAVSGPGGSKFNWISRAGTLAAPMMIANSMKAHPEEGHLANALGALGGVAGTAYGFPALGALGAPMLGAAGAAVGRGVGHVLGSRPKDQLP